MRMRKITERYTVQDWIADGRKNIKIYLDGQDVDNVVEMGDGYVIKYKVPYAIFNDCIDQETIYGEVWVEEVE